MVINHHYLLIDNNTIDLSNFFQNHSHATRNNLGLIPLLEIELYGNQIHNDDSLTLRI
jgi:hypothetical protein